MMVSVLMPTYNHEPYIAEAIESFLAQRCSFPIELLISDDVSSDRTAEIASSYAERFPHQIVVIRKTENEGLIRNYKTLTDRAQGKYWAVLESDDRWNDAYKLQKQVDFLEQNPGYGLCHTYAEAIDEKGRIIDRFFANTYYPADENQYARELEQNCVIAPTACFRADLFRRTCNIKDYIDRQFRTFDYPTWLGLCAESKFHCIEAYTAQYRVVRSSLSNSADFSKRMAFAESLSQVIDYAVEKYGDGNLDAFRLNNIRIMPQLVVASQFGNVPALNRLSKTVKPLDLKTFIIRYVPRLWLWKCKKVQNEA